MNEFASALSTALHEEAQEIAMSADMQKAGWAGRKTSSNGHGGILEKRGAV